MREKFKELQERMHKLIDEKGMNHEETIKISQDLDDIIVELQKEERDRVS